LVTPANSHFFGCFAFINCPISGSFYTHFIKRAYKKNKDDGDDNDNDGILA
jgi:hypothetical protein